jgi:hypothetical protein
MKNYETSKVKRMKEIRSEIENNIPKPLNRSSSVRFNKDNSLTNSKQPQEIMEKIYEFQKKKHENIKKIEEEMLYDQGVTFKPKLNEAINQNINSSLIERNEEFLKNRSSKVGRTPTNEDLECTFTPKINLNSNNIINRSSMEIGKDPGQRLFEYQNIYKQNLDNKKEMMKENYSFKPEISRNTYNILKQKDIMVEELKSKYLKEGSTEGTQNMNFNSKQQRASSIYNTNINEIEENPYENDSCVVYEADTPDKSKGTIKENKRGKSPNKIYDE